MKDFYKKNEEAIREELRSVMPFLAAILKLEGTERLLKMIYGNADQAAELTRKKVKVLCSKGCSFCCHDKIIMSHIEGQHFLSNLKKLNIKPNRGRLKRQNKTKFENLKWKDKACSFLGEDGSCTIYEIRPLICRTHNNIGNSVDDCDKSENPNKTVLESYTIEMTARSFALFLLSGDKPEVTIHGLLKNKY
ncbi:MAG TPA: YkgJ family cysteine cluster protein [Flavobacteriaceae bacterium]|nr:YkgJ family cysteine cluster protein [Flavobacteriaceae bacterium]